MAIVVEVAQHRFTLSVVGSLRAMRKAWRAYPAPLKSFLLICFGVMAVSVAAALAALPAGWEVMGTTPPMEWGLLIAAYVVFAITTSGLCLTVSLGSVLHIDALRPIEKRGALFALMSIIAAFGIILLDLQYPVRLVFGAILSPSPLSPMWWMGVAYGGYLVILLVEVATMYTNLLVLHQWAATGAAIMAFIAPSTLGTVFGIIGAKAMWHGIWTPALMLSSAFLAGVSVASIIAAVVVRFSRKSHVRTQQLAMPALRKILAVTLLVVAALVAHEVITGLNGSERGLAAATRTLIEGWFSVPFWTLRIGVGLLVPLVILLLPYASQPIGLFVAGAASLLGVFVDRFLFVLAGEATPVTAVAGSAEFPFALYVPSVVEVLIVAGAVATVAAGYALAEHHLDLGESSGAHGDYGIARAVRRLRRHSTGEVTA